MPHRSLSGLALCASLVAFLVLAPAAPAQVSPGRKSHAAAPPRRARAFDLFGGVPGAQTEQLAGNRVRCTVWDMGLACANPFGSGTVEDGFWPAGTEDAYVFDGGLQVGAVVPADAGFKWARDTVGVFFFDARGPQRMGSTVSGLFDSRNASDLAVWPAAAYANDTSLFDARLIGRQAVSDQDTWVRYWDGDPRVGTGRSHMMGVVVDQRTLAFNRGYHQDILYFIYRLINVTSRQPRPMRDSVRRGTRPPSSSSWRRLARPSRTRRRRGMRRSGSRRPATRSTTCTSGTPRTRTSATSPTTISRPRSCRSTWWRR